MAIEFHRRITGMFTRGKTDTAVPAAVARAAAGLATPPMGTPAPSVEPHVVVPFADQIAAVEATKAVTDAYFPAIRAEMERRGDATVARWINVTVEEHGLDEHGLRLRCTADMPVGGGFRSIAMRVLLNRGRIVAIAAD